MNGKNHAVAGTGAGIATAISFAKAGSIEGVLFSIPCAIIGAKLPDVDSKSTKQGKVFSAFRMVIIPVSMIFSVLYLYLVLYHDMKFNFTFLVVPILLVWALRDGTWFWGHRHGTHTLFFPALFLIISIILNKEYKIISECILSIFWGYLSHLMADMLTTQGAPVLYPFYKGNISLTNVKSKEEEKCRVMAIGICLVYIIAAIIL